MADLTVDLFISLDGFAGGGDEAYFGYDGPELQKQINDVMSTPHAILMGRVTYELLASQLNEIPILVVSNTLEEPLAASNTRLVSGDLEPAIRELKQESDVPLRTIGSLSLVKGLLEAGLVDRLRLTIFPLVLGEKGIEPFSVGRTQTGLDLVDTKVLDSRVVVLEYEPAKGDR